MYEPVNARYETLHYERLVDLIVRSGTIHQ
jgi:hypothetical protein